MAEHRSEIGQGDPLTWILGSSRSGSTWLLRMLAELDGVATIDDPHLGHHLGAWRPISLAWAAAEEPVELRRLAEIKSGKRSYFFNDRYAAAWRPALRDLISARFGAEAVDRLGGRQPRAIVVKEPGSQVAGLLLSLFPRSRLIFLLRDGRDVVDSWLDGYQRGSWAIPEGAFELADHGREALIRWQASVWAYRTRAVREAYEAHDPERRLLVRYEDLLADPVAELRRICPITGLGAGPGLERRLREIVARHAFDRLPEHRRGNGHARRRAEPGAWRENLSASEQRAMLDALGPELEWALRAGARGAVAEPAVAGS